MLCSPSKTQCEDQPTFCTVNTGDGGLCVQWWTSECRRLVFGNVNSPPLFTSMSNPIITSKWSVAMKKWKCYDVFFIWLWWAHRLRDLLNSIPLMASTSSPSPSSSLVAFESDYTEIMCAVASIKGNWFAILNKRDRRYGCGWLLDAPSSLAFPPFHSHSWADTNLATVAEKLSVAIAQLEGRLSVRHRQSPYANGRLDRRADGCCPLMPNARYGVCVFPVPALDHHSLAACLMSHSS